MEAVMVAWHEELARREAAAAEQVERLRGQIAELAEQLNAAEQLMSRLTITRETMSKILVEADGPDEIDVNSTDSSPRSPIGLMLVPQRRPGMPRWR
ncbi:hypothetical protein ACIP5Y_06970 [Nocardia sp. NPDC088792]|uniref:hypothetical protein n=1 Tax=Nocardia sp. NPDC088792 TaxID=3364332 RepID=UPI0037F33D83